MDDRSDDKKADEMDRELARHSNNAIYFDWPEISAEIERVRSKVRRKMTNEQRKLSPRQ